MAKRKPLSDYRTQKMHKRRDNGLAPQSPPERLHSIITPSHAPLAPTPSNQPARSRRRTKQARSNSTNPPPTEDTTCAQRLKPTLGNRFHSLPSELRAHVFAQLLVQPVKWDLAHVSSNCDEWAATRNTCNVACANDEYYRDWRTQQRLRRIDMDPAPWRSSWAPPQPNVYVCASCYEDRLRPRPFPRKALLPCLCARRRNLEVLLVSRRWYEEGATVFYTRNVFAFEDLDTFVDFSSNLPARWRKTISKISIVMTTGTLPSPNSEASEEEPSTKHLLPLTYNLLGNFLSLTYLELDQAFLARSKSVRALLRLQVPNLRQLCLVSHTPEGKRTAEDLHRIWPELYHRRVVQGGFAEEVARAVKGQSSSLKGPESRKVLNAGIEAIVASQIKLGIAAS